MDIIDLSARRARRDGERRDEVNSIEAEIDATLAALGSAAAYGIAVERIAPIDGRDDRG